MPEDLGDRTEQPTSRRLRDARGRGQVAKSQNLAAAIDLVGSLALLVSMGMSLMMGLTALMRHLLSPAGEASIAGVGGVGGAGGVGGLTPDQESMGSLMLWTLERTSILLAPWLLSLFGIAAISQFAQVGWHVTTQPLMPKLTRLNPLSGLQRLFGRRNLVRSCLDAVKLCIAIGLTAWFIARQAPGIVALPTLEVQAGVMVIAALVRDLCIWLLALALVIGIADYAYQRWQHIRDLRMTKQEVKDEQRSMEGDAEVKGRRLRMARQMILQRIRQNVPTADVIVTNPTHFAVALRYDPETMDAPRVVAKGADYLAFRIREIAAANAVPIIEKPTLARALYHGVEVGRSVPPQFFEAVAEVLAHVYRLKSPAPAAA